MTTQKPASVLFGASSNELGWQAVIHMVAKRLGRHFGFQAFNLDSRTTEAKPSFTPATIFLVTDHLHYLLVKNYMRRDKSDATDEERFIRAIYRLHGGIFQAYRDWCGHVDLPPRLPHLEYSSMCKERGKILEWEYLLEELALYFLVYSEASNVRHTPELLWFIFWIMRNSQKRIAAVTGCPQNSANSASHIMYLEEARSIIRKQIHLRNKYHDAITKMRREFNVQDVGDYKDDTELQEIKRRAGHELSNMLPGMSMEISLLVDMVAYGDSGSFLDRVIEPIFNYFAEEVTSKQKKGVDIQARVAYDDCNESLCSREQVHKVLKDLGIKINMRRRRIHMDQDPYETLLSVGEVGSTIMHADNQAPARSSTFAWNCQNATKWWKSQAFGKTFVERRSWITMGRAFFRVWLFLILEFQTMCLFLWAWDGNYRWYWMTTLVGTHSFACLCYEIAGAWTQRGNKKIRVHGNPFWRYYARGILDWLVINAVLALSFVAQWYDFFAGVKLWWYVAGAYTGIVVVHAVITQRDGYCVSLTNSIGSMFRMCGLLPLAWLFEWIGRSSARPPAIHYLAPYHLRVGWPTYISNAVFWILVIAAKIAFDWFAVMQTMKNSVLALFHYANWQGTRIVEVPNPLGPDFPPVEEVQPTGYDLDIILCIARVIPGFIVVMNDMQIFYYVIGAVFGALKGLVQLNLGSISSFQELVLTFHKAPGYWWRRCISKSGAKNIKDRVEQVMSKDISGAPVNAFETPYETARRKNSVHDALLSEQVFTSTSVLRTQMQRMESKVSRLHLEDSSLPVWLAFSDVWNAAIDELRDLDLVSNKERDSLKFVDIFIDETTHVIPGMRPIMLPIFFYGGQVARALESPGDDPTQLVVVSEMKALLLYILAQTQIIAADHVETFVQFEPLRNARSLEHKAIRNKGIDQVSRLCDCLEAIMRPANDENATRERGRAMGRLRSLLLDLHRSIRYEVDMVLKVHTKPARGSSETDASRLKNLHATNLNILLEELLHGILTAEGWGSFFGEEGMLNYLHHESEETTPKSNVKKVVSHLKKMMTTSAKGAQPRGEEAIRILSFFMGSLKNPTLEKPPSLDEMLSWTVLTPHYEEDVLYALNAREVAIHFGMKGANLKGLSDLTSPNSDGVTIMAWLRSNYPLEWDNLMERLKPALDKANIDPKSVRESDFDEGGPLASERMHLLHWASFRGQHLARTVRGMMAYDKALRLLAKIENPNPGVSALRYNSSIDDLVRSKFSYVVASQNYGALRKSGEPRKRWIARGVEILLHQNPGLRVAFLDTVSTSSTSCQYSVLVRARLGTPVEDPQCTEEIYRIRLPVNRLPDPSNGIILGEGKPENQNASIIFCFGEVIQAIDMNQDNYLFEALKMRNLIHEFNAPAHTEDTWKSALSPYARRASGPNRVSIPTTISTNYAVINGNPPPFANDTTTSKTVMAYEKPWPDMRNMPVALIGFREWIFSQDSGALASFAAATEFTFGSMVQRIMTWPGGVRFHYGHPDLWNKLFVMTRGGVSKATRGFHISEDVFAGYNHVLRGGKVKFKEYISVGKGRDMGFDQINGFEAKVSGGNGEQVMSRDVFRLGTTFDFFRLLSFYHSGPGFFINSYLVMLSVYANIWMLTLLALTDNQVLQDPNDPTQTISTLTGQSTSVAVQQLVQIGMFSIITYAVELLLEYGMIHTLATLALQILQGSIAFFVFRTRTTARYFLSDIQYGGAKYISTGRGYQLHHNSFVRVYSTYARTHLYYAFELLLLLVLLALVGGNNYAVTTWSTWLVSISILWAPFWFNPASFVLEKTMDDFDAWRLWMRDVVDPDINSTWDKWNKAQLEKARNDKVFQTNPLATTLRGILGSLPTAILTVGSITNLENTQWNKWAVFGVITGTFWVSVFMMIITYKTLITRKQYRVWRLVRTVVVLALLAFMICAIVFVPTVGGGVGLKNIILIIFANFSGAVVVAQVLLYVGNRSLPMRNVVDGAYRVLDYILGYFFFFFLFVFSFLQVFDWVQTALLYNIKFQKKLEQARMLGSNNYLSTYVDRSLDRNNNNMRKEFDTKLRSFAQNSV